MICNTVHWEIGISSFDLNQTLLDASPLSMITNPRTSPENQACKNWLERLVRDGVRVMIPEIVDYEVWRELLRAGKKERFGRLDALKSLLG
jgi:predicted nucleic acid-binding protein